MAIRIFNKCLNTHLLDQYGIDGISVDIKDGKDSRHICSCGNTLAGNIDTCPVCGNTKWTNVSSYRYSRWYSKTTDICVKTRGEYELEKIASDNYQVVRYYLNLVIDNTAQHFVLGEVKETCSNISFNKLEFPNTNSPAIELKMGSAYEFIFNHLDDIEAEDLRDDLRRSYEIVSIILPASHGYLTKVFALNSCSSVKRVLTNENLSKYKKFWKETIDKNRFDSGDPWDGTICSTMDEFFTACHLPVEFKAYYASKDFNYAYGWYRSSELDLKQFAKLPAELKATLKHAIEHQVIYLYDVTNIVKWSAGVSEQKLLLLSKFIKKHGMTYMNRIFDVFQERLKVVEENGWDEEALISPKKFSVGQIEELLSRRKFPQTRIDGFINCVDNDTFFAVGLLTSKAQLKKDEAAKIYK